VALVIVVEDEEQVRVLAEEILQDAGHSTLAAEGVESAKALIDAHPDFDVVLTDLELGEESEGGIIVGQYARQKNARASLIYTTGKSLTDGLLAAFVEGHMFISKPYTADLIISAVAKASGNSGA
jgi:DNA-binding NtrC family response regulator